jgi:hypothetical protein
MVEDRMRCEDVTLGLARGELPAGTDQHIVGCEACAARVLRHLEAQEAAALPDAEGLRASLQAELARETGPIAFVRSRSTAVRSALGLGAGMLLVLWIAVFDARPDLGHLSWGTLLSGLALCAAYLVMLPEALRALHAPARRALRRALVLVGLGLPVLASLIIASTAPAGAASGPPGCIAFGCVLALLLLGTLTVLDRDSLRSPSAGLLAATAAAVVANVALSMHCGDERLSHLLVWHAPVGLALVAAYFAARSLARALA